ncbi:MAG: alkaline phosphatase PafA [Bacteroidota bacterium]
MNRLILFFFSYLICFNSFGQRKQQENKHHDLPPIVIGITIDQMRADYVDRFWDDFSEDGFKRIVLKGAQAKNCQYNYMPTFTGPGHAAIYTGSTPAYNGIVANDWYIRETNKMTYCASDSTVVGIGTTSASGKMSPHYLCATTIGDELKLSNNGKSKVIGIALKDRGAILPAGRTADAAYWFIGANEGKWVSSSWYMDSLPNWVNEFNKLSFAANYYRTQQWILRRTEEHYDESMPDNNPYEIPFKGTIRPTFPYDCDSLSKLNGQFEMLKATPFGNSLTLDFALAAIKGENLGKDNYTDLLCLSFSATDYVGHQFGIQSIELQDTYIRLDLEIARLLGELDKQFGKNNYLVFISADHAGAPTPSALKNNKGSAGYWNSDSFESAIESHLQEIYGPGDWVLNETNQNIFLNRTLIREKKISLFEIQEKAMQFCNENPNIQSAYTATALAKGNLTDYFAQKVQRGYSNQSGDVIYILKPNFMEYGPQGTTHGSPFTYDSHVPFYMYGKNVHPTTNYSLVHVTDIAPTICSYLGIGFPSACIGNPIPQMLKSSKK